ncbi:MAG: glycoside hydrolase family 127 protein [Clostridiales bacterium]|nr:glycoside hydrolase family 127 protein [Clostridiales bacterium]
MRCFSKKPGFADALRVSLVPNSIFEASERTGLEYIKSVEVDRLLAPSFETRGLTAPNNAQRYGGWERKGANNWETSADTFTLAGHSLGHWMSAAAVFYRDTEDEELLEMLNYAVDKLDYLQRITNSAYIGGCGEECFTRLFDGDVSSWSRGYWVPWYGIHKIYQGLLDAYAYTGNETAFAVLKKFADWAVDGTAGLNDLQMQTMLEVEHGGMNEIFAFMYELTGEEKYLNTARRFTHDMVTEPLISGRDCLTGLHANTQIPKIVGAAKIYEQSPHKYKAYRTACENFWDFVVNNRSYAIGGNSISEHFENEGAETLGVKTCESCNTYNMMRLTEHLFSWKHDSAYMDWYEDALYNHILGQQEPKTGAKMYFVSLLPGHHRVYEIKGESWWCCTGTGMENPGRYTRCIYYEDKDELYVNLYMPNTYTWADKGLTFKMETEYPYSDNIKMTVTEGCGYASINFRAPAWLEEKMTVEVNGKSLASGVGEYLAAVRDWKAGDVIDIKIPMSVRVYRSREDNKIAYKYGPVTLAAPLGSVEGVNGAEEYISNETVIDTKTQSVPYIITGNKKAEDLAELTDKASLTFTVKAENNSGGNDIRLVPFYGVHHQFYTVYWNVNTETDGFFKALNDVTIDKVEPDGQQDEIGHCKKTNTSGNIHQGSFTGADGKIHMYRSAWGTTDEGSDELPYFSYVLKAGAGQSFLYAVYRGLTEHTGDFNILIDGEKIADQTIDNSMGVYSVFYEIPKSLTQGKKTVTVKLQAKTAASCAEALELRITSGVVSK